MEIFVYECKLPLRILLKSLAGRNTKVVLAKNASPLLPIYLKL